MPCGTPQHTLPPPSHQTKTFPDLAGCHVRCLQGNSEERPDAVRIYLWETVHVSGTVLQSIRRQSTPTKRFSPNRSQSPSRFFFFFSSLRRSTRTLIKCAGGRKHSPPLFFSAVGCDKKWGRREGRRQRKLKSTNIVPTMSTTTTNRVCVCVCVAPRRDCPLPHRPPSQQLHREKKKQKCKATWY